MGIPVELWRARIGSFRCRGSTPKGHYAGVSDIAARLAAAYSCRHSKLVPDRGGGIAAIFLLRVIVNGTRVLLRMVSRHILARLFKMADPDMKSLQLSSRTALLLCGSGTDLGAVMRVMLVTASLTVSRDAMMHLLALLQCNQAQDYAAGYCSTEQQYSGGGVVTLQCMIAAERLLAATLVYMMLILAGDIETNPGPTLNDAPKMGDLLVKVASNCHDKCLIVGLQLFLPFSQLYAIESRNHNPINCFAEIFDLWERQADLPYTWVTIIDVLRSPAVNENKLAFEVEHWLSLEDMTDFSLSAAQVADDTLKNVKIRDLMNKVADQCRDKWKLVGILLNISYSRLNAIENKYHESLHCFAEVFDIWKLQGRLPYTWATIIDVLKSPAVAEERLALKIEDWLLAEGFAPAAPLQPSLPQLSPPPADATISGDQLSAMFRMMKEKGTFNLRMLHLVLHGLPTVGKTCVKLKLIGKELTDQKPAKIVNDKLKYPDDNGARSTLVAEDILRARAPFTALGAEDKPWQLLNFDEEKFSMARIISDSAEEPASNTAMAREQQTTELTPEPAAIDVKGYQQLAHLFENVPKKRPNPIDIRRGTLMYLIDSGGQPQFQQFLPSLVSGPSVFLLTFSLAIHLHDEYEVAFIHSDGKRVAYPTKIIVYNVLQQSLASIRCTCSYQTSGDVKVKVQPRVILMGTMKSLVNDSQIAAINKDLMPLLKEFGADLIVPHGADKVVFPIDSFTGEGILELRQIIQDLASRPVSKFIDGKPYKLPMCEVKLPVPSVALELLLRSQDKSIISLEQCQEMARDFEILSVTELESVLWQLHHFTGSIRYYPDDDTLKQYVVTRPKILYDVPSFLITRTFGFENAGLVSCYDAKKIMQAKGIFTMSTLVQLWNEQDYCLTDLLLTPSVLVALLLHLNIIAELDESGDRKFFMPSALVHGRVSSSMKNDPVEDDSALVCFKGGYTPNGVFGLVLAYLLNKKELENTHWSLDESDSSLRCNQATLVVSVNSKYELLVTLRMHIRFLEVKVKQESEDYPAVAPALMREGCAVILNCIQHAVQTVVKDLHYTSCADLKQGLYFHCCQCPLGTTTPHAAEFKEEGRGLCHGRSSKPDKCWEIKWNKDAHEYGTQNSNVLDPSSYWKLRKCCKYKGEGTTLMVFDTGIDKTHPSFASRKNNTSLWLPQEQLRAQFTCDDKHELGHGTICAGIACGDKYTITDKDGNKFTCRGVAPEAKLGIWKTSIRESEKEWETEFKNLTEYMCTESNKQKPPVDVLVISSGHPDRNIVPRRCFKKLKKLGIIVVCAGSNDGDTKLENIAYPALYPETICVGSHNHQGKPSDFSPVGVEMDFLAPGEHIVGPKSKTCIISKNQGLSKESHKYFLICKGTSFAAPALGGLICLILQALKESYYCPEVPPHIKCEFIKQVLISLTNQKSDSKVNNDIGYGVIAKDCLEKFFRIPKDD